MILPRLIKTICNIAFLSIFALPNYAMDPPSFEAREEERIKNLARGLKDCVNEQAKAKIPLRQALGQYIARDDAKHLKKLFESIDTIIDLKKELNTVGNAFPPLLYRALQKDVSDELIEVLLNYGANPNIKLHRTFLKTEKYISGMIQGSTAVHIAVKNNRSKELLLILAKFGANFGEPDVNKMTPLVLAKDNPVIKETIEIILGLPQARTSKPWRAQLP